MEPDGYDSYEAEFEIRPITEDCWVEVQNPASPHCGKRGYVWAIGFNLPPFEAEVVWSTGGPSVWFNALDLVRVDPTPEEDRLSFATTCEMGEFVVTVEPNTLWLVATIDGETAMLAGTREVLRLPESFRRPGRWTCMVNVELESQEVVGLSGPYDPAEDMTTG